MYTKYTLHSLDIWIGILTANFEDINIVTLDSRKKKNIVYFI